MTHDVEWTKALHHRIAKAIRDARRGRLTAQELADETERLGYPITRSQIANYESGRKQSLDVSELIVIAAALKVPPLSLLFPDAPDRQIEALPGQPTSTFDAMTQFVGNRELIWPRAEVGALTAQLTRIESAISGADLRDTGRSPRVPKSKEETQ